MHQEKARARMPFDQAGRFHRMRAAKDRRAQVHLHRQIVLASQATKPVHDQIAKGLPLGGRRRGLSPGLSGKLFVRLIKGDVAVVGQRIFQSDLVA